MRTLRFQQTKTFSPGVMFLILLITGTFFIQNASSLKCNETACHLDMEECGGEEKQCSAEFTRCGSLRHLFYVGDTKDTDVLHVSCFKENDCQDGSFNLGVAKYYFTSLCCGTDNCNTKMPPGPNMNSKPNGRKCHQCDGGTNCGGVVNCEGDETFCATIADEDEVLMGCATRSLCDNPSSRLLIFDNDSLRAKCCEGDYCNKDGVKDVRNSSACVQPLSVLLISLYFVSNVFFQ